MRVYPFTTLFVAWLVGFLTHLLVHASPSAIAPALSVPSVYIDQRGLEHEPEEDLDWTHQPAAVPLHGRGNGHTHFSGTPMTDLNETLILMHHKATPLSYGTHDLEDQDVSNVHPGLMVLHVLLLSSAFFVVLPMSIALRTVEHPMHGIAVVAFYALCALGIAASMLYRKLTPNMYKGAVHAKQGYLILLCAVALTTMDTFWTLQRMYGYAFAVRAGERKFSLGSLWKILSGLDDGTSKLGLGHEYTGLILEEREEMLTMDPQDLNLHDLCRQSETRGNTTFRWVENIREFGHHPHHRSSEWQASVDDDIQFRSGSVSPRGSHHSDDTLQDLATFGTGNHSSGNASCSRRIRRVGRMAFATVERALIFLGYMQVITGLVIYTGICRDNYINVCLAHLIKGGIFWCYGLVTFARFLGAFADVGWSWNIAPRPDGNNSLMTAEFVECLVIFLYGITNTWMERLGASPGSPYTSKQIQHIGIAVMFWFAGLVGMGLESRRIRNWLAAPSSIAYAARSAGASTSPTPPSSYRVSFNPFPALVIGITGAAMSAHAQAYVFQMQIHIIWGNLLAAFAILRWLTYFFVWLGPPKSVLPGRPPTEALASFFLACGGLMFQLSTEEITIAAMRRGHADQMMFLNVAVAFTCFAFCWVLAVVSFKGWLTMRAVRSTSLSKSTTCSAIAA